MEFKSQIATTREQSEQLLALGLKPETADMCYNGYFENKPLEINRNNAIQDKKYIPAWSLSRLLEMMPLFFRKVIHIQIMPPVVSYWEGVRHSDIYENIISMIAWLISNGYFNTEYLKGETK